MSGDVILRHCPECGRQTAHDAVALSAGADIQPAKITVHFCTVHRGAQREAVRELARLALQIWGDADKRSVP